jgi:NAD dependent epimerase/dehydratase family enzyme
MKIFLTGASGLVGSRVLDILLKKNHDVWVLIHDPNRLEEFQHKSVHAMTGNAEENGSWLAQLPDKIDVTIDTITPQLLPRLSLKQVESTIAPLLFNIGKNISYAAGKTNCQRLYTLADVHCYINSGIEITEKSALNRDANDIGRLYMDILPYLQSQKNIAVTTLMHGIIYDSQGHTRPEIPKIAGKIPLIAGNTLVALTHAEDLANAIVFAVESNFDQSFLNVVDDKPISQKEFLSYLALRNQTTTIPLPAFLASPMIGDIMTKTLSTSIQVKNQQLKSLGYWLKFPDIQAGFAPGTI